MGSLLDRARALLGFSAYEPPGPGFGVQLSSAVVERTREALGGQIQPIPNTQLRWYLADLESAQAQADAGNLTIYGQMWRAMQRDGYLLGLVTTRTRAVVRAPKRFYGEQSVVDSLRKEVFRTANNEDSRCVFDEMCPPAELEALDADGIAMGVGVAELVPVRRRKYPVLVRLDPEWLQYRWQESRWYYQSRAGLMPITPGDGKWVLHMPGGRIAPWRWGLLPASGRAFIMKEHAISLRGAFIAGIANPAKIMQSPSGSTEQQRRAMFQHLFQWGPNMAVELPPGWEMKLLESTGKSWQVFQQEIDTADTQYMVGWAGQIVTTTGGKAFGNAEVPRVVRGDLLGADGQAIDYTINTQVLPQYVYDNFGIDALDKGTSVVHDTKEPKDMAQIADTFTKVAAAIEKLRVQFPDLNAGELARSFGIPLLTENGRITGSAPAVVRELDYQDRTEKLLLAERATSGSPANDTSQAAE